MFEVLMFLDNGDDTVTQHVTRQPFMSSDSAKLFIAKCQHTDEAQGWKGRSYAIRVKTGEPDANGVR